MKHDIAKMIEVHGGSIDQDELLDKMPHPESEVLRAIRDMMERDEISYNLEWNLQLDRGWSG